VADDSIIKRRLTSLRDRRATVAQRKAHALAALQIRADANGVDVETQASIDRPNDFALTCRPMPLSFYYGQDSVEGRDAALMRRREGFYAMCAKVFGFEGWRLDHYSHEIFLAARVAEGRDGREMQMMPIDRTQAVNINANAAPLEWLVSQNWLETKADPAGFAMLRFAVALHFRDAVRGSQSGGLKAQTYEGGGGGFGPRLVSDYALDCMGAVSAVRAKLHPGLYRLLHMVVVEDVWMWEADAARIEKRLPRRRPSQPDDAKRFDRMRRRLLKLRRGRILTKLHKAIDGAAVVFGYMSEPEYRARWVTPRRSAPSSPR
jgi:hypothetical protein